MAISRNTKENHVSEIKDLISNNNIIVVWDYLGLSASDISEIRAKFRNEKAVNRVYKNRIAKIAFKESGKEEILEVLEGPSSFLFINNDESNALKELNNFIKEHEGEISFKAGYIDGEYYDAESIAEIAGLPSKDDLLSMLLSALTGTMRNLVYAISQVAESAPADVASAVDETTTEEAEVEEAEAQKEDTIDEVSEEE